MPSSLHPAPSAEPRLAYAAYFVAALRASHHEDPSAMAEAVACLEATLAQNQA